MSAEDRTALIDGEKRLGTVTRVSATGIELNLPQALAVAGHRGIARGTVGDFVFIDCDQVAVLGRIIEVNVPDRSRPALERQNEREPRVEPVGRIQLLATVQKTTQKVVRGVSVYPKIGDGVFEADGPALSQSIQDALFGGVEIADEASEPIAVRLGKISRIKDACISVPPENLFGRHCGIFGATGGGKSWTLAKLVGEVSRLGGKAIVFDPTGEFSGKVPDAVEYAFTQVEGNQALVHFPYEKMTELSLFALLRPSGQSQAPAMREAIRSLRLARALCKDTTIRKENEGNRWKFTSEHFGEFCIQKDGTIHKSGQRISDFNLASAYYSKEKNTEICDFNIQNLATQISNECIYATGYNNDGIFGKMNESTLNHCNTLILRVQATLESPELKCLFGEEGQDISDILGTFSNIDQQRIKLISLKNVSFNYNARELLLNTIGQYLLDLARSGHFKENPVICFLDEAHQFMGRSVGDEANNVALDAFGLIAKEGRKYGLSTVLATQRPRDLPQDVLSQLGTIIVHRLTNESDRRTIERACGDLDRTAADFIPSLSQGEAILLGPDLPIPLPINIQAPPKSSQPTSHGPDYQNSWLGENEDAVTKLIEHQ